MRVQDAMAAASGHGAAADVPPPLVEAKLAVPGVRHGVVDRPQVRRLLDAGRQASLTLVAAPAGHGKTTAVRDWCASLEVAPAWVVLDAGDNDPVLLWRYVATAVDRVRPGLGRVALRRLEVAGGPVEVAVDELLNGLAALPGPQAGSSNDRADPSPVRGWIGAPQGEAMTQHAAEMVGQAVAQIDSVSPKDAFDEMTAGHVVFLDVREPVEWGTTSPAPCRSHAACWSSSPIRPVRSTTPSSTRPGA